MTDYTVDEIMCATLASRNRAARVAHMISSTV